MRLPIKSAHELFVNIEISMYLFDIIYISYSLNQDPIAYITDDIYEYQ